MISLDAAITQLTSQADPDKAREMAAYHKVDRPYWGVPNPALDTHAASWRHSLSVDDRLALADGLWRTNAHEGRICATKLLTQARIRPDDSEAWKLIQSWVPDFDAWAIADHACMAGQRRLIWQPARLDDVSTWTQSPHMWTRRAALVITLPWTKQRNPKPAEIEARERILQWAAGYVDDHDWFIQKAIGWWLRELSKRDAERVQQFISDHGDRMKPFAVKESLRKIKQA